MGGDQARVEQVLDLHVTQRAEHVPANLRRAPRDLADELLHLLAPRVSRAASIGGAADDREALLLWDAGLSYPEIARQTGLAVGSVGTTLARARRRLVEAYREKERGDVARG